MQLSIEIQNENLVKKIIKLLEIFKDDGVKIKTISKDNLGNSTSYDVEYEKSFQYKTDRADFLEMKESL